MHKALLSARDVKTREDLTLLIKERGITHIKVGFFDLDGVMAGKLMAVNKFLSSLDSSFAFCGVVFGWDIADKLYDGVKMAGWDTGYTDAEIEILPFTCRELPLENNTILVQGQVVGELEALCPRQILDSVLEQADEMGYSTYSGFEYEFLAVDESHETLRTKNFNSPKPLGNGGFGYSILRTSVNNDFYEGLLELCNDMELPIEGLHEETGPGQLEVALEVMETSRAADNAALFKTFSKVLAQRQNRMVSFMAKWHPDYSGQGGHIHVSLKNKDGSSAFYDETKPDKISNDMRWFIGGLQRYASDFMAFHAPTVNSYRRLVPGCWAPTSAFWGVDNRTTAIRAIVGNPKSQRIEYRVPGADANPYLSVAAIFAAGLQGIKDKTEPTNVQTGNAYKAVVPPELTLPRTLWDAAQTLRQSTVAEQWLGKDFCEHFAIMKEWEEKEFQMHVTNWELNRYFEAI